MPPLRRYLRITRHSVLEVRIYIDNPTAPTTRWLLSALPRVIAAVRPLVLPKLREENQLSGGGKKGKKKGRGWKDVVVQDEFEVAVFLTETSARHSILRRERFVRGVEGEVTGTRDGKVTGTRDEPVVVGGEGGEGVGVVREESEEQSGVRLADVPVAGGKEEAEIGNEGRGGEELFVEDGEDEGDGASGSGKRKRLDTDVGGGDSGEDEKKKMLMDTTYDGFSIYGRILCLVVKRRGTAKGKEGAGQAMMEEWIASTQMGEGGMMDD